MERATAAAAAAAAASASAAAHYDKEQRSPSPLRRPRTMRLRPSDLARVLGRAVQVDSIKNPC